jgi:hypothetical protein
MKISISHAKEFVEQYRLASGVTLAEQDVLRCLEHVFAETVPATPDPEDPKLTEESIRKMMDDYLTVLKMQEVSPKTEYPYWPDIPYWPTYPQSGIYAYGASFPPPSRNLDQTYGTGVASNQGHYTPSSADEGLKNE